MLKGELIYLKLIERSDINILYNLCNDNNVNKYNTVLPDKKYLFDNINMIKKLPNKILSIINENNVIIGLIDYRSYYSSEYTIGITIGKRFWGRGYGKDSIKTLTKYLFRELNAEKIIVEVIENNIRAIKCCKDCGFIRKGISKINDEITIIKMCLLKK